jgi:hypothetical protein
MFQAIRDKYSADAEFGVIDQNRYRLPLRERKSVKVEGNEVLPGRFPEFFVNPPAEEGECVFAPVRRGHSAHRKPRHREAMDRAHPIAMDSRMELLANLELTEVRSRNVIRSRDARLLAHAARRAEARPWHETPAGWTGREGVIGDGCQRTVTVALPVVPVLPLGKLRAGVLADDGLPSPFTPCAPWDTQHPLDTGPHATRRTVEGRRFG